jgi:hypothetical protein
MDSRSPLSDLSRSGKQESNALPLLAWEMAARPGPPSVVSLDSEPADLAVRQVRLRFLTPTELKGGGGLGTGRVEGPEFGVLFARLRDRISTLRALYGAGPLEDRLPRSRRARARGGTGFERCQLDERPPPFEPHRPIAPAGRLHGVVEYAGELGEFLPWLRAARWTGVGRQTVWGKGDVRVI